MAKKRSYKPVFTGLALCLTVLYFFTSYQRKQQYKRDYHLPKNQLLRELESNKDWKTQGLNFQPSLDTLTPTRWATSLESQLALAFPYDASAQFPRTIWQTWKVALDDPAFPKRYTNYQRTWDDHNPEYKHYVIPDEQCDYLVDELFRSTCPDVARAYQLLPKSIMKADFFRYLILFARGGVYSDIDTVNLKPVDTWVSNWEHYLGREQRAGIVVGIEADPDRPDWHEWYARRIQFCQWSIQSKRGHPLLLRLIAKITELTLERDKRGTLHKVMGKDSGGDIMEWTGPGIFTDAVFDYINSLLSSSPMMMMNEHEGVRGRKVKEEVVDWKLFTGMTKPIAIDDVLILPITAFSPDVNQMGAKDSNDEQALVKHVFSGSWKDDNKV
ncbi:uncharacterized protein LODBEIA_P34410 [Lodderomyces beijingensis]|uniref:Initiation-specific alpha-1,6-mannosyltransferase n=1 Tax=Lodderomyces beijingensis TaxID=1775926 RepID=A0ABP0ZPE8_9ASCO